MTPAQFRIRFPEFEFASNEFLQVNLTEAALYVDLDMWGERAKMATAYLAAHQMALSPQGQAAKMVVTGQKGAPEDMTTIYQQHYNRLARIVTAGYRVVGILPDLDILQCP